MTGVASLTLARPRPTVREVRMKHIRHTSHNCEEGR